MAELDKKKCPICKKTSDVQFHPFCSKRCAQVDLGQWFNEKYTIETEEPVQLEDYEDMISQ